MWNLGWEGETRTWCIQIFNFFFTCPNSRIMHFFFDLLIWNIHENLPLTSWVVLLAPCPQAMGYIQPWRHCFFFIFYYYCWDRASHIENPLLYSTASRGVWKGNTRPHVETTPSPLGVAQHKEVMAQARINCRQTARRLIYQSQVSELGQHWFR